MSLEVVIVDDESYFREGLADLLRAYCPSVRVIAEADGVARGREVIEATNPPLIFLDIQMEDGSGFDLLRQLNPRPFEVIFTTAFDQYALEAIKLSALDYLLKPIDPQELILAVNKAVTRLGQRRQGDRAEQYQTALHNYDSRTQSKKLVLKDVDNLYLLNAEDIIRCEAKGSYTLFVVEGRSDILISQNLREYEKILKPCGFYRPHHSHLFNLRHLDHYEKGRGGHLVMKDGSRVPVSIRRKELILQLLTQA